MMYDIQPILNSLISRYHDAEQRQAAAYEQAGREYELHISDGVYMPDVLKTRLNEARETADREFLAVGVQLNSELQEAFKRLRAEIRSRTGPSRATDHASRVLLAIKLMEAEGAELTDDRAAFILREFIAGHDFDELSNMERIVRATLPADVQLTDPYGDTKWPETFGGLYRFRRLQTMLNAMESDAQGMFTIPKYRDTDGEKASLRQHYKQMFQESTLPEQAHDLNAAITEFFQE